MPCDIHRHRQCVEAAPLDVRFATKLSGGHPGIQLEIVAMAPQEYRFATMLGQLQPSLQNDGLPAPKEASFSQVRVKQIQAIIRPEKLDPVKDALVALGINGMTVTAVQGFGQQMGHTEVYRGVKLEARLLSKVMITAVVKDDNVDEVIQAILASARTGEIGDGKIIVTNVENSIRIRTGETGDITLTN